MKNSKGEWGHGQHELNIRYENILTMADHHCIFKQCLKETAEQIGWSVTFMAKYASDQAGSGCHLHISLWQGNNNCFAGNKTIAGIKCSDEFCWFLAGWMKYFPELMVFYAPTVNSYKRYQDASWAPTSLAWSPDNRTAGFRIVGEGESLRIECRIPGADCNPYLAFAAAIASGLDGIKNRIELTEPFRGNAYTATSSDHVEKLPLTLDEALALFAKSRFARETFGQDVMEYYHHFFELEIKAYQQAVTDWEKRRYFEQI
ncbi:glutamine synthetase family protein [Piscirickettsia litoralis]|uniref:glutamine synthetase family protein n=1 Tax=Piscirickettsia litoralis TaxID=1891921 RepID=UPI000AED180F|nr:hypothetical protein [Piscirickettsia litoralis]